MLQWSEHQVLERLRLNVDLNITKIRSRICMDERNAGLGSKNFFWHLSLQKEAAGAKNIGERNSGNILEI